jgi:peptidoglycan/xylan/chitin deacetylase (PgdA/CDA1 family)
MGLSNTEKKVYLTFDDGPTQKLQNGFGKTKSAAPKLLLHWKNIEAYPSILKINRKETFSRQSHLRSFKRMEDHK